MANILLSTRCTELPGQPIRGSIRVDCCECGHQCWGSPESLKAAGPGHLVICNHCFPETAQPVPVTVTRGMLDELVREAEEAN